MLIYFHAAFTENYIAFLILNVIIKKNSGGIV